MVGADDDDGAVFKFRPAARAFAADEFAVHDGAERTAEIDEFIAVLGLHDLEVFPGDVPALLLLRKFKDAGWRFALVEIGGSENLLPSSF